MSATTKSARLGCEALEARENPSVAYAYVDTDHNLIVATAGPTDVAINDRAWYAEVRDNATGATWNFAHSSYYWIWVFGSDGADRIVNNVSTKQLFAYGYGGDDYLEGYSQNDYLYGGNGNDTLVGYAGDDHLYGDAGNDTISGMDGDDWLYGGGDDDFITGGYGGDVEFGDTGNDRLGGYWSGSYFIDDPGNDWIYGDDGNDSADGGSGNEFMYMGAGDDYAFGGTGDDWIEGWAGADALYGGDGNDILFGRDSSNTYSWFNIELAVDGGAGYDYQDFGNGYVYRG